MDRRILKRAVVKVVLIGVLIGATAAVLAASSREPKRRRNSKPVQKLSAGGSVRIQNPSGPITVDGWDQDTVQATVEGSEGEGQVSVQEESSGIVSIRPNVQVRQRRGEVHLVIKIPRSAGIESLSTGRGAVQVTGVQGPVNVRTNSGELRIANVGPLSASTSNGDIQVNSVSGTARLESQSGSVEASDISGRANIQTANGDVRAVRTGQLLIHSNSGGITADSVNGSATLETNNGDVTVKDVTGDVIAKLQSGDFRGEDIGGLVNLTITSGEARATRIGGDLRVTAISSDIDVKCVKGSVELASVSGSITLNGIAGDASAVSTSGSVTFNGPIRPRGHYRLKSVSGEVSLRIPADSPGFTATLASYSGEIQTDFPIKLDSPIQSGPINRRVVGRYGDGQSEITLDSFSGTALLGKLSPGRAPICK
ncbi:MAG TPA: hypothetical protein VI756_31530 [Blastocatellia bacterium]